MAQKVEMNRLIEHMSLQAVNSGKYMNIVGVIVFVEGPQNFHDFFMLGNFRVIWALDRYTLISKGIKLCTNL